MSVWGDTKGKLSITDFLIMNRKIVVIFSCLILSLSASLSAFAATVSDVVSSVSQTDYRNYLDNMLYTHTGDNRGVSGAQHDLARDNIYSEFNSFGLTSSYNPFQRNGYSGNNVVGIHQGRTRPNDIYIIGSHYDSVSNPGADDNASGTAGVLEAARVLSGYDFEATLVFIAFDREEQGLLGSKDYAQQHAADNIIGMVSLDMIAYNDGSNQARIYGRDSSNPFKESLADAVSAYGNGISAVINDTLDASDHAPFEAKGFQAALLIEYGLWNNPNFHSLNDNIDMPNYIDYSFATNLVSSTVGFFATNAILIPEPASAMIIIIGVVFFRPRRKKK
jgi:hypothetical protein